MTAVERLGKAENWDEDFDFRRAKRPIDESASAAENWDDDFEDQTTNQHSPPRSRKRQQQQQSPFRIGASTTENWDDDFEDRSQNSPQRHRISTSKSTATENWDEEFTDTNPVVENWDDEFDGAQSSDDDCGAEREEDHTVTARSRRVASPNLFLPPPVPLMPDDLNIRESLQFPGSPSTSIFSLPTTVGTNRPESSAGYSYTSTMGLRSTLSNGPVLSSARRFAGLPESPPIQRERRRLRKKSRPPHMDGTLIELDDRLPDSPTSPSRPCTPELMVVQAEELIPQTPPNASASMPSTKTPLLSRIGSVKKWRSGRKRSSTEPQEVQDESSRRRLRRSIDNDIEVTPRPPNVLAKVQSNPSGEKESSNSIRILRHSESVDRSGELRSEKSKDRIFIGLGPSPAKNRWKKHSSREPSPSPSPIHGSYKRPSSLMIHASGGSGKSRHVSSSSLVFGVNKSAAGSRASFSASVEDLTHRLVKSVSKDRSRVDEGEEGRSLMGGIRRMSFGNSGGRNEDANGQGDDVKIPKERDKDRRHKKSRSSLSGLDIGKESTVSDRPPQIPDLPTFPLTPIFSILPDPPPRSNELLLAPEVHSTLSVSSSEPLHSTKLKSEALKPLPIHLNSPQHSASLGRSALPPKNNDSAAVSVQQGGKVARRNSLSDLKIPVRISQAQMGLKRDLGMVKEFARNVEQLKELQYTYNSLVLEVQIILNSTRTRPSTPAPPSRPTSPTKIFHSRKRSRSSATAMPRSTIATQMSISLQEIETKYSTAWECAELLIELGGGAASMSKVPSRASLASNPLPVSNSAPPEMIIRTKSRERAVTLAGDEHSPSLPSVGLPPVTKPSQNSAEWRAPTGRHDLSQRQLVLLREMLSHSEAMGSEDVHVHTSGSLLVPDGETVNREWSWGTDPGGSTITLPPSENSSVRHGDRSPTKKRRSSRLGMSAVRDMLRNLKRSVTEQAHGLHPSSGSSIAISEHTGRRRAKTSTGPESTKSLRDRDSPFPSFNNNPRSPYGTSTSAITKSPRRPSLASIFKFSKSNKPNANSGEQTVDNFKNKTPAGSSSGTRSGNVTTDHEDEEEDWDRIGDSTSDLDFHSPKEPPPDGSGTLRAPKVKGKNTDSSPYMHHEELPPQPSKRGGLGPDASRSSIWEGTWSRGSKLSNVEETAENLTPSKTPSKQPVPPVPPPPVFRVSSRPPSRSKRPSGDIPSVQNGGNPASVMSEPPQWLDYVIGQVPHQSQQQQPLPDPKLAMKPENIKPLLENARVVQMRCGECVSEMRLLVSLGALGEEATLRT